MRRIGLTLLLGLMLVGVPFLVLAQEPKNPLLESLIDAALRDVSRQIHMPQTRDSVELLTQRAEFAGANLGCTAEQADYPTIPAYWINIQVKPDGFKMPPEKLIFIYHARLDGTRLFECVDKTTPGPNLPVILPPTPASIVPTLIPSRHTNPITASSAGTPVIIKHQRIGNGNAYALAWSADSKILAVGGTLGIFLYTSDLKGIVHLDANTEPVTALAWNPNGKQIASVNRDRSVQLWDVASGNMQTLIHLPPTGLQFDNSWKWEADFNGAVSYSPDGSLFATANFDNLVRIWDSQTGKLAYTLPLDGPLYYVAWHPAGKGIAVSGTHKIDYTDPQSGKRGKVFANFLQLLDAKTGKVLESEDVQKTNWETYVDDSDELEPLHMGQWTVNGKALSYFTYRYQLWALEPGADEFYSADYLIAGGGGYVDAAYSPDGQAWVATAYGLNAYCGYRMGASSVQIHTPTLNGRMFTGFDIPHAMAWSPDNHYLALVQGEGNLLIVDGTRKQPDPESALYDIYPQFQTDSFAVLPYDGRWSADRTRVVFTEYRNTAHKYLLTINVAAIKDLTNGQTLQAVNFDNINESVPFKPGVNWTDSDVIGGLPDDTVFSPNERLIVVSSPYKIMIIDTATQKIVNRLKLTEPEGGGCTYAVHPSWSPDGSKIAASEPKMWGEYGNASLIIWDVNSNKHLRLPYVHGSLWSPDSRLVLAKVNGINRSYVVIDALTGSTVLDLSEVKEADILKWRWEPRGRSIAALLKDKTTRIWNIPSGQLAQNLPAQGVEWTLDGSRLAVIADDHTINIYDTAAGKISASFTSPDTVLFTAFSPDSTLIATPGDDGTIHIWHVATGKPVLDLVGHKGRLVSVQWKPNSKQLLSQGSDGTYRIWTMR